MYVMKRIPPVLMMFLMLLSGGLNADSKTKTENTEAVNTEEVDSRQADLLPAYPGWPDRYRRSDMIPPPPPGPYMSSALSRVNAFPDRGGLRNEYREGQMESPFFRPEMPWPQERGRPYRWIPKSGEYSYVPDGFEERLDSRIPAPMPPPRRAWRYAYPQQPPARPRYYGHRGY